MLKNCLQRRRLGHWLGVILWHEPEWKTPILARQTAKYDQPIQFQAAIARQRKTLRLASAGFPLDGCLGQKDFVFYKIILQIFFGACAASPPTLAMAGVAVRPDAPKTMAGQRVVSSIGDWQ
jgi:hypothetical protein